MAQSQSATEVVPKDFEVTESARKWQHELDELHARHAQLKVADQAEFEAERESIAAFVEERRDEQRAKLDADVHKYMTTVQEIMDVTLAELHEEKLQRLENEFEKRLLEREKTRDRHLLEHLKKYKSIVDASASPPEPRLVVASNSSPAVKSRKPLPGDRRQGLHSEEKAPVSKAAPPPPSFQSATQPQRRLSKTKKHVEIPGEQGQPAEVPAQAQPLTPTQNGPNGQGSADVVPPGASVDVGRVMDPSNVQKGGKRKMSDQSPTEQENTSKRQRVQENSEYGQEVVFASSASPSRRSMAQKSTEKAEKSDKVKKSDEPAKPQNSHQSEMAANPQKKSKKQVISFNEVFQDGEAEFKHTIVEFPPNTNEWYILRCDEHHVHFGLQPLLGAAKHLHSVQHKNLPKLHTLAVDLLGHLVVDCTRELAAKNNAVVKKAFDKGYVPFNVNRLTRGEKISQGYLPADSPNATSKKGGRPPSAQHNSTAAAAAAAVAAANAKKTPKTSIGITNPIPGELYLGYWSKTKTKYAIMVFPFQGSIEVTGLKGDTLASVGLVTNAPRCVRVNRSSLTIQGWAKEYEDGGAMATKREFPVVYFDRKHQVGWLPVKYISPFDFEDPKAGSIPEYYQARDRYAQLKNFASYEAMKAERGPPPYVDVNGGKDYFASPSPSPTTNDAMEDDSPAAESPNAAGTIEDDQAEQARQPIHEDEHTSTRVNSVADDEMADAPPLVADNDTESYVESVDQNTDDDEYGMRARQGGMEAPLTAPSSHGSPRGTTAPPKAAQTESTPDLSQPADKGGSSIMASGPARSLLQDALNSAQQIAAKALNLSPEREVSPSVREELPLTTSSSKITQAITAAAALHEITKPPTDGNESQPAASVRYPPGGLPRISSIQDILGTDISPIRQRPATAIDGGGHDIPASKSVSPSPTPGEKVVPPPRFPSAQPLRNGIAAPPPPPSGMSRNPGVSPRKQAVSTPLTQLRQMPQETVTPRSTSSTPGPTSATDSLSRKSTPTVLKAGDMDKWKAVRNSSSAEPLTAPPVQADTPKESRGTASPRSTPSASVKADPSGEGGRSQDFDIVSYHGDSRRWVREPKGSCLRLSVDPSRPSIAETGPTEALHVTVDPRRVATMLSEATDAPGATAVELIMREGVTGRQRLVFETRDSGGRLESDKLQVRRFAKWVKSINPAVVYQPHINRDEARRLSSGTTRESPVTIE